MRRRVFLALPAVAAAGALAPAAATVTRLKVGPTEVRTLPYPMINGRRYHFAGVRVMWNGMEIARVKSIDTGPIILGAVW